MPKICYTTLGAAFLAGTFVGYLIWDDSYVVSNLHKQIKGLRHSHTSSEEHRDAMLHRFFDEFAHERTTIRVKGMENAFQEWNVNEHAQQFYFDQAETIFKKSLLVEEAIKRLSYARKRFEHDFRNLIGEQAFKAYFQYEAQSQARSEYEKFYEYCLRSGGGQDAAVNKELLIDLLHNANAYTAPSWHGPFDALPIPQIGPVAVANQLERELPILVCNAQELLQTVKRLGLNHEFEANLRDYFQVAVDGKNQELAKLKNRRDE